MIKVSWYYTIRIVLALLLLLVAGGTGNVVAHQRGDVSLPAENSGDAWEQIGAEFMAPESEAAAGVEGDIYVLPASGSEVVVAAGVTVVSDENSTVLDQIIVSIPGGIGAVAALEGIFSAVATMDAYATGFGEGAASMEEVYWEGDREYSEGLYQIDLGAGTGMTYMFISVDAVTNPGFHIIQVVVAPEEAFAESIVLLRDNVFLDGVPMFADVNETEIDDRIVRDDVG